MQNSIIGLFACASKVLTNEIEICLLGVKVRAPLLRDSEVKKRVYIRSTTSKPADVTVSIHSFIHSFSHTFTECHRLALLLQHRNNIVFRPLLRDQVTRQDRV